jgi:hypothetical protein
MRGRWLPGDERPGDASHPTPFSAFSAEKSATLSIRHPFFPIRQLPPSRATFILDQAKQTT